MSLVYLRGFSTKSTSIHLPWIFAITYTIWVVPTLFLPRYVECDPSQVVWENLPEAWAEDKKTDVLGCGPVCEPCYQILDSSFWTDGPFWGKGHHGVKLTLRQGLEHTRIEWSAASMFRSPPFLHLASDCSPWCRCLRWLRVHGNRDRVAWQLCQIRRWQQARALRWWNCAWISCPKKWMLFWTKSAVGETHHVLRREWMQCPSSWLPSAWCSRRRMSQRQATPDPAWYLDWVTTMQVNSKIHLEIWEPTSRILIFQVSS